MIRFQCSGAQTCVDPYRGNEVTEWLAAPYWTVVKDKSWSLQKMLHNNFIPLVKLVTDEQTWVMRLE